MKGSGKQHECWIFCCDRGVCAADGGIGCATDSGAAMILAESSSALPALDGGHPQLLYFHLEDLNSREATWAGGGYSQHGRCSSDMDVDGSYSSPASFKETGPS